MSDEAQITVGAIAGAFGVRGEVRLKSFCANPEDIARYGPLLLEGAGEVEITIARPVKGGFAARLSGVRSKEQADALRGRKLSVAREKLPKLPDDEFYHSDLIGLAAVDTGGAPYGKVAAVHNHGAGDILELREIAGVKGALLLPFTRAVVPTIDLDAGRVVIDPPQDTEEG